MTKKTATKTTTKTTAAKSATTTEPTNAGNLDGIISEAHEHLQKLIAAFVIVDGAPDGFHCEARDDLRSQFNDSAHLVFESLEALRDEMKAVST